jgi:hypothetical protein
MFYVDLARIKTIRGKNQKGVYKQELDYFATLKIEKDGQNQESYSFWLHKMHHGSASSQINLASEAWPDNICFAVIFPKSQLIRISISLFTVMRECILQNDQSTKIGCNIVYK